jgi:hypothetical protein
VGLNHHFSDYQSNTLPLSYTLLKKVFRATGIEPVRGGFKTHCLYLLAIPHYQKFVQKKLKTLRVSNFVYHTFLIRIGRVKIKATNQMFVKNFRLELLELLLLYFFLRKLKKKRLYLTFFTLTPRCFLRFLCIRLDLKNLFLAIKCRITFFLEKGNVSPKVSFLKKMEYKYALNFFFPKTLNLGFLFRKKVLAREYRLLKTLTKRKTFLSPAVNTSHFVPSPLSMLFFLKLEGTLNGNLLKIKGNLGVKNFIPFIHRYLRVLRFNSPAK